MALNYGYSGSSYKPDENEFVSKYGSQIYGSEPSNMGKFFGAPGLNNFAYANAVLTDQTGPKPSNKADLEYARLVSQFGPAVAERTMNSRLHREQRREKAAQEAAAAQQRANELGLGTFQDYLNHVGAYPMPSGPGSAMKNLHTWMKNGTMAGYRPTVNNAVSGMARPSMYAARPSGDFGGLRGGWINSFYG